MLLFLLPLYISRARSAPLSSIFLGPVVLEDDITGVAATRTLWNIVYTCFTTTFAITWISMHPNIPNKKHPLYPVVLRLLLATYALLIPEAIVFWAAVQWKSAHECLKIIQCHNIGTGEATRKWSITHSFFLLMGGFTVACKEAKHGYRVIPVHEFVTLVKSDAIIFPDIEEEDLKDKSKGDPLAKGFVILQTLWFVIQILARFAQRLVVTELEVITFALVPLNVATYYFWMHKPLGVKRPIRLQLSAGYLSMGDSPTIDKSPSVIPSQGILDRFFRWFTKTVDSWADEADEMWNPDHHQHTPTPGRMTGLEQSNLNAPSHSGSQQETNSGTQDTTESKKRANFSFKTVTTVLIRVVTFIKDQFNKVRGKSQMVPTNSGEDQSSIAFMTKSIIGGVIALVVVIFIAIFAILSISPLLFVALGFLCLAILTAPWVATRAFHAIGTEPNTADKDKKQGPTLYIFYAPKLDKRSSNIMLGVTIIGATVFGGLHLLAWNFQFPTPVEHLLWRISSLALTALPALYLGCHLLTEYVFLGMSTIKKVKEGENDRDKSNHGHEANKSKSEQEGNERGGEGIKNADKTKSQFMNKINGPARDFIRFWILLGIPAYTLARLYVLAEAVVALRDPKPGTLSAVTWSKFIPHF